MSAADVRRILLGCRGDPVVRAGSDSPASEPTDLCSDSLAELAPPRVRLWTCSCWGCTTPPETPERPVHDGHGAGPGRGRPSRPRRHRIPALPAVARARRLSRAADARGRRRRCRSPGCAIRCRRRRARAAHRHGRGVHRCTPPACRAAVPTSSIAVSPVLLPCSPGCAGAARPDGARRRHPGPLQPGADWRPASTSAARRPGRPARGLAARRADGVAVVHEQFARDLAALGVDPAR